MLVEVYKFSPTTKEYLGTQWMHECQKEPGIFHIPANTTTIEPPEIEEEHTKQKWNGEEWEIVPDWRNEHIMLPDCHTVIKLNSFGIDARDVGRVLNEQELRAYKAGIRPFIRKESEFKFNYVRPDNKKILIIVQN